MQYTMVQNQFEFNRSFI